MKRRMLRAAVEENVATILGVVPRSLRSQHRFFQVMLRGSIAAAIPMSIVAASFLLAPSAGDASRQMAALAPAMMISASRPDALSVGPVSENESQTFAAPRPINPGLFPLDIRRVVIDAGHGGHDGGTAPSSLLVEKDLTLDISQRLKSILEKNQFRVVMTRRSDEAISLQQRASIANESNGDVFVSVHLNWIAGSRKVHGVETYVVGATDDPELERLAAAENQNSGYSMADFRTLLDGIYADVRRDESSKLARAVQGELFSNLRPVNPSLEDWGVKRAPFIVLVATGMPAILAEVACVSNEKESQLLKDPNYRQRIAEALFRGIRAYADTRTDQKGT